MRVAIVTGAASEVGRAICSQLREAGRIVVGFYGADEGYFESWVGPSHMCNLDDPEACRVAINEVESSFGAIDVLINGVDFRQARPFHEMTVDEWDIHVNANLHSLYNICRPVIPGMRERRFGRVVNLSSVAGQSGGEDLTAYATAKAAVIGFTRALALENARYGVTVNAIAPGAILTDAQPGGCGRALEEPPAGRLGSPDDVARCARFLTEDGSSFITGETLSVNGGGYLS